MITENREQLVRSFEKRVKTLAKRYIAKSPSCLEECDLMGAGFLGLLDAMEKFNPKMGTNFHTYAEIRVKGAILDEMRRMDWASRSIRERIKRLRSASKELEAELERPPEEEDLAEKLGVSVDELSRMFAEPENYSFSSIDDLIRGESGLPSPTSSGPEEEFEKLEVEEEVFQAIRELPPMERIVLALYYYFELTLKEIGNILGVGESRVCQIRTSAIKRLKKKLTEDWRE